MAWPESHPRLLGLMMVVAGALWPLAFAPFGFWPLAALLPLILLWAWDQVTPRWAATLGGLFGLGAYGVGISWIFISLHEYGHAPAPFAALATFLVVLAMALYWAVLGGVLVRWGPPPGPGRWLLAFPALWSLLDWVRSWLFSGFPWLALGYSQTDAPLGQLAPYLGVFGVGWAVLFSAGLLWTLAHAASRRARLGWLALLAGVWLSAWGLGQIRWVELAGPPLRVALVQGNVAQDRKWEPEALEETLSRYVRLSVAEHGHSQVIVWPETAIPVFLREAGSFIAALTEEARKAEVDYLTGIPSGSAATGGFHNSILGLGRTPGIYHKRRLLPFGEFLPWRWFFQFFRDWVDIPMADFTPGAVRQPLLRAGGQPVGLSICFEAVFGAEIRRALPEATWLVNVSNDAWFKDSLAPHQHLQIARLRAMEVSRSLARATNTGISALVDERGRMTARAPQFQATVVRGEIQPWRGLTPYARWGDGPIVVLLVGMLALGWFWDRRVKPA